MTANLRHNYIDLTQNDQDDQSPGDPFLTDAEIDPSFAERLRTQTIRDWQARKQPKEGSALDAIKNGPSISTGGLVSPAQIDGAAEDEDSPSTLRTPKQIFSPISVAPPDQPTHNTRHDILGRSSLFTLPQNAKRCPVIGCSNSKTYTPQNQFKLRDHMTKKHSWPPLSPLNVANSLHSEGSEPSAESNTTLALPTDCTRCPVSRCSNSHTYARGSPSLISHIERKHNLKVQLSNGMTTAAASSFSAVNDQPGTLNVSLSDSAPVSNGFSVRNGTPTDDASPEESVTNGNRLLRQDPPPGLFNTFAGRKRTIDGRFQAQQPSRLDFASGRLGPLKDKTVPEALNLTEQLVKKMKSAISPEINAYVPEENDLLIYVKEDLGLGWPEIAKFFPHRTGWQTLQSRYSGRLRGSWTPWFRRQNGAPSASLGESRSQKRNSRLFEPFVPKHPDPPASVPQELVVAPKENQTEQPPRILRTLRQRPPENIFLEPESSRPRSFVEPLTRSDSFRRFLDVKSRQTLNQELNRNRAAFTSMVLKVSRNLIHMEPSRESYKTVSQPNHSRKRTSVHFQRPYLDQAERQLLSDSIYDGSWDLDEAIKWHGETLHVDFTQDEIEIIEPIIVSVRPQCHSSALDTIQSRIHELLKGVTDQEMDQIGIRVIRQGNFMNRTLDSIKAFLLDASRHSGPNCGVDCISAQRIDIADQSFHLDARLHRREVGNCKRIREGLKSRLHDTLGPSLLFKGTSSDVNCVSWARNGDNFVVGSTAFTDASSMQYNRPNNLLFGSLQSKALWELPDHAICRHASTGLNATPAMQATQDPFLFPTVSAVEFSDNVMLTAGYDSHVRLWELGDRTSAPNLAWKVPCVYPIDLLAVSSSGFFATATNTSGASSVRVWRYGLDDSGSLSSCDKVAKFESTHAIESPELQIKPSCLRWGPPIHDQSRFLLGGFSANDGGERRGETCLWDVVAGQSIGHSINRRNIFDVAWSPCTYGRIAIGCNAGSNVSRATKSVLRIHDSRLVSNSLLLNSHCSYELDCPALDMNDIRFNPHDESVISVGCTDGISYVWDLRNPAQNIHRFAHGKPLVELDDTRPREEVDTGVRYLEWNYSGRLLYTGSSDGLVAAWNPYVAADDAFHREVVQLDSGVMVGAFSPDYSNLLVGDVQGTINMLGVGNEDRSLAESESFTFYDARDTKEGMRAEFGKEIGRAQDDSGVACARELLEDGKIQLRPFGDFPVRQAVQGPNYDGPYDETPQADTIRREAKEFQTQALETETSARDRARIPLITCEEEVTDSGAWRDRIPERLRQAVDLNDVDEAIRSLRCSRCQKRSLFKPQPEFEEQSNSDVLVCLDCRQAWRIDILGYSPTNLPGVELGSGRDPGLIAEDANRMSTASTSSSLSNEVEMKQRNQEKQKARRQRLKPVNAPEWIHDMWDIDELVRTRLHISD